MIPGDKFLQPIEDWSFIAKIKDEHAKKHIDYEGNGEKQRRFQYKNELDKQLNFKRQNSPKYQNNNDDDREFPKVQILAFKNSESQQKQIELQRKEKKVQEERQDLQKQLQEKILKEQLAGIEKTRERESVTRKVEEMKNIEGRYSDFYKKRIQNVDEKNKYFKPSVESFDKKQEFIKKRCGEWEVKNNEKIGFKEKYKTESRNIVKTRVKDKFLKQIDYKTKSKNLEYQEGIKYQKLSQQESFEENNKTKLKHTQNIIEQDRKQQESQLDSKQFHSLSKLKGESIERFSQRAFNQIIDSRYKLGIPSLLDSSGQIQPKQALQKIYSLNRNDFIANTSFSPDRIPTKNDINQSYEQIYTKRPLFFELNKYNPIINQISSSIPKILQGQRGGKGFKSQPKLNSFKDIFNHV
ncbi:hypothetical protein SteCoe_9892 [Stentor coeruleus]|uniref:Uncharacterized protein n=1 Tax=Stentor coeruleus TaxID=5963 RepID=A0A1R2CGY4_9CILI|nr:hypothetical protein SteCoe_9892 [Stentor coeruleus]